MKNSLNYKLKIKPKVLKPLGVLYNSAQVIYPYIFIPSFLSDKLVKNDLETLCIIEHEIVHFNRMKEIGILKWYFSYIFNRKFRLSEEVIAYRKQKFILESHGTVFNLEKYSTILSGWTYLKMISKEKARSLLETEDYSQD